MQKLQQRLDAGSKMPFPDGLLINGHPKNTAIAAKPG